MSQKLRSLIGERVASFGSTPEGSDWCVKALHPSDPNLTLCGVPDSCTAPTILLNYQTQATVAAPNAALTTPWSYSATMVPDPVTFAWGYTSQLDGATEVGGQAVIQNSQLEGTTHALKMVSFLKSAERWRLAYAGLTITQDGPSLTNQGMVSVAQIPIEPTTACASFFVAAGLRPALPVQYWQASDLPSFDKNAAYPSAYLAESKHGVYIPLKLDETSREWHSSSDCVFCPSSLSTSGTAWMPSCPSATCPSNFPHGAEGSAASAEAIWYNPTVATYGGTPTSRMCNSRVAQVCFKNLSPATQLTMYFRYGFEVQCQTASPLSPLAKASPALDHTALDTYAMISRELKDAYPAEYNDLGKLWGVISKALRSVGPTLGMIPKVGPILALAAPAAADLGDAIRKRVEKKKSSNRKKNVTK